MGSYPLPAKAMLHLYLQRSRDALLWKLDGLGERAVRWPWTPTGTNLLGIVKHAAGVEIGYFGEAFGREWTGEELPWMATEADDNSDMWATAEESTEYIVDLYQRVWRFADETITSHELDAPANVPWWPPERRRVSLEHIITHVTSDLARHGGHADILRELTDGTAGWRQDAGNLAPFDTAGWHEYVAKLTAVAQSFAE